MTLIRVVSAAFVSSPRDLGVDSLQRRLHTELGAGIGELRVEAGVFGRSSAGRACAPVSPGKTPRNRLKIASRSNIESVMNRD